MLLTLTKSMLVKHNRFRLTLHLILEECKNNLKNECESKEKIVNFYLHLLRVIFMGDFSFYFAGILSSIISFHQHYVQKL